MGCGRTPDCRTPVLRRPPVPTHHPTPPHTTSDGPELGPPPRPFGGRRIRTAPGQRWKETTRSLDFASPVTPRFHRPRHATRGLGGFVRKRRLGVDPEAFLRRLLGRRRRGYRDRTVGSRPVPETPSRPGERHYGGGPTDSRSHHGQDPDSRAVGGKADDGPHTHGS